MRIPSRLIFIIPLQRNLKRFQIYKRKILPSTDCGLHLFKELLDGKWKLMAIAFIYQGFDRPSTLLRKIKNADRRVLKKQLDDLIQHGFVSRKPQGTKLPKVVYQITELGVSLIPILEAIEMWGEENRLELEKSLYNDEKYSDTVF